MRNRLGCVFLSAIAGLLTGCGSGRQPVQPAPQPDFTITASASSVALTPGGAAQAVALSATALYGFTGSIQVTINGLPAGVTASPGALSLVPGMPQQVSFSAAASSASASVSVQFTGAAGALSHSISLSLSVGASAPVAPDVVTYHYDLARTGLNASEATLTLANVNASHFGLQRVLAMDGKVDGQPLYLSSLSIGGQQRNVVFGVSEHDSVYAFDADTGAQIWKTSVLGANETTSDDHGCNQISPEIGITSTPVIDRQFGQHGTIFVVGMSKDSGGGYHQRLHALDLTTGAESSGSPVEIHATYPGAGANSSGGNVVFDPGQYAERAGLLLLNGTLYMGWTSHCDQGAYTGWLMGYSESTLMQTSVLNLTPNGSEGSIWMSGGGLAADAGGNIYFLDANGTFDTTLDVGGFPAQHDFGNAFMKVSTSGGNLAVADYFAASNTVALSDADQDLGSGGVLLLPDVQDASGNVRHLAIGGGKDSNLYLVNRDAMGKFNPQNNSALYQEVAAGGMVYSTPAYFNGTVFTGAVDDFLKAWPISDARLASSRAQTATRFVYPGTTPAVSANGTANGIVWAVENSSPAVLHAYDATTLQELYNSNQAANGRDHFGDGNKFITPVIVNGKVFVGTPNGLAEFGLLP